MSAQTSYNSISMRASFMSYIALSGIWVLLAIGYTFLSLRNPGYGLELGAFIAGGVALLWCIWLSGFKITVSDGSVEYRDGFFKSSKIYLREIADVKRKDIEIKVFTRKIKIPRIVVITQTGVAALLINPKPFGRIDLQKIINNAKSCQ